MRVRRAEMSRGTHILPFEYRTTMGYYVWRTCILVKVGELDLLVRHRQLKLVIIILGLFNVPQAGAPGTPD